jgi:hypothetical protein
VPVVKESVPDIVTGQGKPSFHQFLLKVDGRIKASFTTIEAAKKPGLKIKEAHSVVQVSVYDSIVGRQIIIGAEEA